MVAPTFAVDPFLPLTSHDSAPKRQIVTVNRAVSSLDYISANPLRPPELPTRKGQGLFSSAGYRGLTLCVAARRFLCAWNEPPYLALSMTG